jgi:hypothetical protein
LGVEPPRGGLKAFPDWPSALRRIGFGFEGRFV